MAALKRSKLLQNAAVQSPIATPKLQNNMKDRPVLVDKTNQIATVRALRNRKIYPDGIVKVSKDLFKNGVIQSPRKSKKCASTKKLTVPRKSSECFVVLEQVDETNNHNLVNKDLHGPDCGKVISTMTTKKTKNIPRKGVKRVGEAQVNELVNKDVDALDSDKQISTKRTKNIPRKGVKKVGETQVNELVNKDVDAPDCAKQISTKRTKNIPRKGVKKVGEAEVNKDLDVPDSDKQISTNRTKNIPREGIEKVDKAQVNELVNKDADAPNSDKQISTKRLGNTPEKTIECYVVLNRINVTTNHKKLVYEDVSPASAEREKTLTPARKKLLYDFKGGSGSSDSSSRKHTRRRKPARKRIKPQIDTSDEENYDVQNVTKKMKMLEACSQVADDINSIEKQDSTYLHSQTLNSSVQPLREQTTNLSMKSETRKFFKTPMRRELIEMSYFNYTNQKKRKFTKSSKALSKKTESSKRHKLQQNSLLYNSYGSSSKLPLQPVVSNENLIPLRMCQATVNSNSKTSEVKPTNSNMMSGLQKITVADKTAVTNNQFPVKTALNENRMQPYRSNTATVSKSRIPVLKFPVTKSGLEQVRPKQVLNKTQVPSVSCAETVEVADADVCPEEPLTISQINYKRGGTTFGLDFTLGETDCSAKTDKSESANQLQESLPSTRATSTVLPASAVPLAGVVKQPQALPPCGTAKQPQALLPGDTVKQPQTLPPSGAVKQPQALLPGGIVKQPQPLPPAGVLRQPQVRSYNTDDGNYITGPVRSIDFFMRYARNISRRHRVEALYVPAASSPEHFTLENYFGFDEEPEEELTLSPVKRQSDTNITAPPLTSTPHISNNKKCTSPDHNRLKPELKEYHHKAKASLSASQNNCSQILAGGGCRYKQATSASKTATFAVPQVMNVPSAAAQNKKAGSSMVQSSITDYIQSTSNVPFETSISNIEGDELSVTHSEPPRKSYERPVRKRRHIEHEEYMSEEEEEQPKVTTFSRKYNGSRRAKRSKKQEKIFEKWASNVSSQFEEIDSIALIVE